MHLKRLVPLSSPHIDAADMQLVHEALASRYLASGPIVERFEQEMAERFGARFAVAVSSGTAALHLALIAAGVGDGDLVITSPFSFIASANAILYERGIPIFVDIDPETLAIDPAKAREAIETLVHRRAGWRALLPRNCNPGEAALRAILPVHIFGRPAEMAGIVAAARHAGIAVIEDACEAVGASSDGTFAGRWGDAGAFGFYPNKQITAGEGGMLVTDDAEWASLFRSLRNQGRATDAQWLRHDRLGFNYRLDEMSGALGLSQLRRLDDLIARREAVAQRYEAGLAGVPGIAPLAPPRPGMTISWFLYVIRVSPEIGRDVLMSRLQARGVTSRPYFWPIHLQPFYAERFGFVRGDFPVSEAAGDSLLALPMPLGSGLDDVDYVCEVLAEEVAAVRGAGAPPRPQSTDASKAAVNPAGGPASAVPGAWPKMTSELELALNAVGADPALRAQFVAACRMVERLPEHRHTAVRDEITGPIVDALHGSAGIVRKELQNGLRFDFHYRSRIARDFVMSMPEKPDHVWEPQTTRLLLHLAGGARHVLVGGAYFGDQAILLAGALRPSDGVCHTFEPNADQRVMLARNAELNGLTNMRINASGLWSDGVTRLRFVGEDACAGTEAAEGDTGAGTVPATSVDAYLDSLGIPDVDLIALDVEGGELAILEGAGRRLALPSGRAPHLVFEVHRSYVDWTDGLERTAIFQYLSSLGYTMFAIRDFQSNYDMRGRPIELVPPSRAHLDGPPHGFNVVATKEPGVLEGEQFVVCRDVSPKLLLHRDPALHHPSGGLA